MNIGYLVNCFPMPSQTFIRREVEALEPMLPAGRTVELFAVRPFEGALPDARDRSLRDRTRYILGGGKVWVGLRLMLSTLLVACTQPRLFLQALRSAWRLGRRNGERGVAHHCIYLAEACVLLRWAHRGRIDHLHVHFGTNSATVALLCRYLGGPQFSMTVHGPAEFDDPAGWALGEKIAASAFSVAISEFGRSQLMRWSNIESWDKIIVVRCGVDEEFLAQAVTVPPVSPRLVHVGRLDGQKGQLVLLDAVAQARSQHPELHLDIIGDGPLRSKLEARIAELGLERNVRLLGWAEGKVVRDIIASARALVMPSFAEGLPVAIMESLALARPVVSTYVAGIPSLVKDGRSGWLVQAGDPTSLSEAIVEVLDASPAALLALGNRGRLDVANNHDSVREAHRLLSFIATDLGWSAPVEPPRERRVGPTVLTAA